MKKYSTEIKWALIFALMTLLWMVGEKMVGLHDQYLDKHMIYTNFYAIPAIAVYVFALLDKRKKDFVGKMTYKQGFVSGLIITLIVTVLSPLTQTIISLVITPDYFVNVIKFAVETKMMTQTEAEAQFNLPNYIMQSSIAALIMGVVTSAVVAIFTRKQQ